MPKTYKAVTLKLNFTVCSETHEIFFWIINNIPFHNEMHNFWTMQNLSEEFVKILLLLQL